MKINPKELLFGILAAGTGVAALWLWHALIPELLLGSGMYDHLTYAIITVIISACFFACSAFFVTNHWVLYGAGALFGITPIFLTNLHGNDSALVLITLFFALLAIYRMQNETRYSCGFNPFKNMRAGLPYFFTAVACAGSIFYFGSLKQDEVVLSLLPRPAFNFTIRILREPLQSITGIPAFDPDETVDELLLSLLKSELQKKNIALNHVPKSEIAKMLASQRAEISARYGLHLTGKETATDVFYQTATDRIEDLARPYKSYLPYLSALAFFFALKAFTLPLYIVSVLITAGLIRLLITSKILTKEIVDMKVERVRLTS